MPAFWVMMKALIAIGLLLIVAGGIWVLWARNLDVLSGISLIFLSIPFLGIGGGAFLFKRARH